jgi:hypothetical protein
VIWFLIDLVCINHTYLIDFGQTLAPQTGAGIAGLLGFAGCAPLRPAFQCASFR